MGVSSCSVGQGVIEGAQASFLPKQWPLQGVCDLKPRGGGFQEEQGCAQGARRCPLGLAPSARRHRPGQLELADGHPAPPPPPAQAQVQRARLNSRLTVAPWATPQPFLAPVFFWKLPEDKGSHHPPF